MKGQDKVPEKQPKEGDRQPFFSAIILCVFFQSNFIEAFDG